MKKHYLKAMALMALMLPLGLSAQDIVRYAWGQKSDFALVRQRNGYAKWIGYNDSPEYFTFGLFDTTGSINLFMKTQQHIHVKDMELSGNTLYFCGSVFDSSSMSNTGIVGFFDISAMPTPTVNYLLFDSLSILKKLEYYMLYSTKHIAMVGTGKDGRDYIADAYYWNNSLNPGSSTWRKSWTYVPNFDAKFDDIALVDTNVVVSARYADSSVACLCYISRATIDDHPFFSGTYIYTKNLKLSPVGPVLLQYAKPDTLFAVYRRSQSLYIHQLKAKRELSVKCISFATFPPHFNEYFDLLDVASDYSKNYLNILIKKVSLLYNYRIYHIPTGSFSSGGTINGHETSATINSLGDSWTNGNTIAAGNMGEWTFYKVQNNAAGSCLSSISATLLDVSVEDANLQRKDHSKVQQSSALSTMPVTSVSATMITQCH